MQLYHGKLMLPPHRLPVPGGLLPHAYWVCAARETPIFSFKFPFRSLSFSQIFKYSAPEHHHFTVFAVPETIISEISFAAHGRLTQVSSVSSLQSTALSRPSHSSSLRSPAFFTLPRHSGVSGRPECQPDASYSPFRRPAAFSRSSSPSSLQSPAFSRSSSLRSPAFLCSHSIRSPPFFTLPRHIPTKIWGEYPPPPPPPGSPSLTCSCLASIAIIARFDRLHHVMHASYNTPILQHIFILVIKYTYCL